jgi:dTDP-4-dehydrorhamnose reductase
MILVTGVTGQVGSECAAILGSEAIAPTESELDLTDKAAVEAFFAAHSGIDGVIHCAAYTAVDKAEDEPQKCEAVNVFATRNLAEAAAKTGAKMLYVSTDYVFDGEKNTPYETDDPTNPQSVYGKTKLEGELAVRAATNRFFIVRTQWVFGNGNNFVKTMVRLMNERDNQCTGAHCASSAPSTASSAQTPVTPIVHAPLRVVADQFGCPTAARDLAATLCEMIKTEKFGVYNASGGGECSWYDFACEIKRLIGSACVVEPVSTAEYPTKAKRPKYSVLSKKSLENNGFAVLPDWKNALLNYL